MSTKCFIIKKNKEIYEGIFCKYDGYPSNVGKTLLRYYTNPERIDKLFSKGNLLTLSRFLNNNEANLNLSKTSRFEVCDYYSNHECYDETEINGYKFQDLKSYLSVYPYAHLYVYDKGKWQVYLNNYDNIIPESITLSEDNVDKL